MLLLGRVRPEPTQKTAVCYPLPIPTRCSANSDVFGILSEIQAAYDTIIRLVLLLSHIALLQSHSLSPLERRGAARGIMATKKLRNTRILALFDVDGTLTAARQSITPEMKTFMGKLMEKVVVGIVGGSDLVKQQEQIGANVIHEYDYSFSENGLIAYKHGELIGKTEISKHLGEEKLKKLINWILRYIADLDIPIKRGTFIEFRAGMLNVSPIGRNCSKSERDEYEKFDLVFYIFLERNTPEDDLLGTRGQEEDGRGNAARVR